MEGRCCFAGVFFFQAEDGIRDRNVTGVQTCALPIYVQSPGPGRLRLQLRPSEEAAIRDSAVRQALETIRTRVDKFGVAEPTIQREGIGAKDRKSVVQLPGVEDPERVKDLIGSPAFLEWKLVKVPPGVVAEQFRPPDSPEVLTRMFGGKLPDDVEILPQEVITQDGKTALLYWPVRS